MCFKLGFVSIVGKPNVGKSTLLNTLVNNKISCISDKPNFTLNKIIGIYHESNLQLVFFDTPGFNNKNCLLSQRMNNVSSQIIETVDVVLFVTTNVFQKDEEIFLNKIKTYQKPILLVVNKIDNFINIQQIDKVILSYLRYFKFNAVIPISALKAQNLNYLKTEILPYLKIGKPYYPTSVITTQKSKDLIAELVREKIFFYCQQEIPYSIGILVERMNQIKPDFIEIWVLILVEKKSQKKILIGSCGSKLKKIGITARIELQKILFKKVRLNLWVKVETKWRDNMHLLQQLGYI